MQTGRNRTTGRAPRLLAEVMDDHHGPKSTFACKDPACENCSPETAAKFEEHYGDYLLRTWKEEDERQKERAREQAEFEDEMARSLGWYPYRELGHAS